MENCENKPISRKIDHFGSFGSFGGLTERFGRTISADLTEKFGRNFGSGRTLNWVHTQNVEIAEFSVTQILREIWQFLILSNTFWFYQHSIKNTKW